MAETIARGVTVHTAGELPVPGSALPPFELTVSRLEQLDSESLAGTRLVLNIFPSVDTATCAMSVRRFNELAASLSDTTVVCVSMDLPYALDRFCGAEGIENVVAASAFRSSFGVDYGVQMVDGPMRGLLARSVVVADADGTVLHTELVVPTGGKEPDYDAALAALG